MEVKVERIGPEKIKVLGIKSWPIWEKEESSFDWYYDTQEHCYFLEGEVEVELPSGETITIKAGDYAIFPEGLRCRWHIKKKVVKHYNFP